MKCVNKWQDPLCNYWKLKPSAWVDWTWLELKDHIIFLFGSAANLKVIHKVQLDNTLASIEMDMWTKDCKVHLTQFPHNFQVWNSWANSCIPLNLSSRWPSNSIPKILNEVRWRCLLFIFWLFEDFPNISQYIRSAEVPMCIVYRRSIYKLFRKPFLGIRLHLTMLIQTMTKESVWV